MQHSISEERKEFCRNICLVQRTVKSLLAVHEEDELNSCRDEVATLESITDLLYMRFCQFAQADEMEANDSSDSTVKTHIPAQGKPVLASYSREFMVRLSLDLMETYG